MSKEVGDLVFQHGYRLADDAWKKHGRRTYIHDDNATRSHLVRLKVDLEKQGWKSDDKAKTFNHPKSHEMIEIEPGGKDVSGHYLHHMKIK